jgi:hypothetical protein
MVELNPHSPTSLHGGARGQLYLHLFAAAAATTTTITTITGELQLVLKPCSLHLLF